MAPSQVLSLGPLSVDFRDGELRYFRVGTEELVRRIYFSVRDEAWGTVIPEIRALSVEQDRAGFRIAYEGHCRNKSLDFAYQVEITAALPGTIRIRATGQPVSNSLANRFGLCVHLGAQAVRGRPFQALPYPSTEAEFPELIGQVILAEGLQGLCYATTSGATMALHLQGGLFGLEDQRHFGDSSFKLFSAMSYVYPKVEDLAVRWQELSLDLAWPEADIPNIIDPRRVLVGPGVLDQVLPVIRKVVPERKPGFFLDAWSAKDQWKGQDVVAWDFDPSVNLQDEQTFSENLAVLEDQARTVRAFAPGKRLNLGSVFCPPASGQGSGQFQTAWVLATVKTAALAGISAVSFFGLSAASKALLTELATLAGVPLLTVGLHADDGQIGERKYEALAFRDGGETIVFLANLTSDPLELQLEIVGTRQMIFQLTGYEVRRCDKLPEPIGIIPLAESGKAGFAHP